MAIGFPHDDYPPTGRRLTRAEKRLFLKRCREAGEAAARHADAMLVNLMARRVTWWTYDARARNDN